MTVRTLEEILEMDGILTDCDSPGQIRWIQDTDVVIKGHSHGGRVYFIEGFHEDDDGNWYPIPRGTSACHIRVYTIYRKGTTNET